MKKHRYGKFISFFRLYDRKINYNSRYVKIYNRGDFFVGNTYQGYQLRIGRSWEVFKAGDCREKDTFHIYVFEEDKEKIDEVISKIENLVKEIKKEGQERLKNIKKNQKTYYEKSSDNSNKSLNN